MITFTEPSLNHPYHQDSQIKDKDRTKKNKHIHDLLRKTNVINFNVYRRKEPNTHIQIDKNEIGTITVSQTKHTHGRRRR